LDEANCFSLETIHEIEFVKYYEVYQDERLGNLIIGEKVEVSKRFIRSHESRSCNFKLRLHCF